MKRQFKKMPARGVGLVTAIFLLVVLAGLAVAMVTLFTTQQASASLDEQGARAYQAARAGIEWGVYQQLRLGKCGDPAQPNQPIQLTLPPNTTLSAFTVTVLCEARDPTGPLPRYVITSTACNQLFNGGCDPEHAPANADYVARTMKVEL